MNCFNYLFATICVVATISCISYCIFQYILDKDVSRIDFVDFHSNRESIYPSISFCVNKPLTFLEKELDKYGTNATAYDAFLLGNVWDAQLANIDYNKVTLNVKDFLLSIRGLTNHFEEFFFHPFEKSTWDPKIYESRVEHVGEVYKCLSVEVPYIRGKTIREFSVFMNTSVFPNAVRPEKSYDFCVYYHYPRQLLRSKIKKCEWEHVNNSTENYVSLFRVWKVEVMKKRNKRSQPCIESWLDDDEYIVSRITEKFGCRPPHWSINTSLPECTGKDIMKNISMEYTPHFYSNYPNPPCQQISHILGSQEEHDSLSDIAKSDSLSNVLSDNPYIRNMNGIFEIKMRFEDEQFMLIEQTRGYDIESLIGNSGGYLGLFLGCAVLQIPQSFSFMLKLVKSWKLQLS